MGYPLGPNVEHTIQFYISQLEYEVLSGRESAVMMLKTMFLSFPAELLNTKGNFVFLTLGIRLINEQSPQCRALVAEALETLLSRLNKNYRDELVNLILVLLQNNKLNHRELGAQFIKRLINVEKKTFTRRVDQIFPALLSSLNDLGSENAGKFVRLKHIVPLDEQGEEAQALKDHSLFQTLNVLRQIFEVCPEVLTCTKYLEMVDELAYSLQSLLAYDHQWVRFGALELLGVILSCIKPHTIYRILKGEESEMSHRFMYSNPSAQARSLVLDMCTQLMPGETDDATAQLIAQNLLIIGNILSDIPLKTDNADNNKSIDLIWMLRRVRYVIQSEVAKSPKSIVLRKNMFNLMESIVDLLNDNALLCLAPSILSPALRELTDKDHVNEDLKQIVERLGCQIKAKIGKEQYDNICFNMQSKIEEKRRLRRRNNAIEKINNPSLAAKRKLTEKNRKREAKRRKSDVLKQQNSKRTYSGEKKINRKTRRLEDLFQS
ncbi:small subunit processome component 20 homolog [Topomyia yanbarensis]|uniref:small subunit processome component 20 homolog n=1 Tax=Topomyia yanbarensis TaxID=2498891 RepID=UPI00273B3D89|nr:small subunit processome component 20 homolog [Topomyia yanbarensis]